MITSGIAWGTPWIEEKDDWVGSRLYQIYEDDYADQITWTYYSAEGSDSLPRNWQIA